MPTLISHPYYTQTIFSPFQRPITHLRYPEADKRNLLPIDGEQKQWLLSAPALAFRSMQAAARLQGVNIQPVSAFRDNAAQQRSFFGEAKKRGISLAERSKISAPPGYSEHSTGYTLDIMDGHFPGTAALELTFEQTPAFSWMQRYSRYFGFELSFPQNNWQGINYEPWHYRWVGDAASAMLFARARSSLIA